MKLSWFVPAALVLLLIPGPVVLYVLTRTLHQGRRAGLVSVAAAALGDLCHVIAATLGLSAVLLTSAIAFSLVKYAGAAYLIYLGLRTLLSGTETPEAEDATASPSRVFAQGVLVTILNPKTALFFLAFLPQFVDPSSASPGSQLLTLGSLFVLMGMATNGLYCSLASVAGSRVLGNRAFQRRQRYVVGGVYVALGVTTAMASANRTP
jgi:threonine/homoserine/homoserine lactone efflux protein